MTESAPTQEIAAGARTCPICEEAYPGDFVVCPRDGARLEDPAGPDETDPLVGNVLGGAFRILRAVGEGATARVYEASHVRLGKKRFAVKVLHSFYAQNATAVARFQREAETAAAIEHDGVVDVYDVNQTSDGRFYIVTEFLSGQDLRSLLGDRGKLPAPLAVRIARGVCQALAAAHVNGVVHRDLKPDNVFVSGPVDAPSVKLIDFGISKIKDGATLTQTGMLVGTPAYMAPEQAAGGTIDARTDVYAVGAMLYRAVTGRRPFEAEETAEVLSAIVSEEPPRPRSLEPGVPEALELAIQRAMSKNAADRFASAEELDQALAALESPEPQAAPTQSPLVLDAKRARPMLAVGTALAFAWTLALLDAAVLALLANGDTEQPDLELGRLLLVSFAVLVVLAGPLALWIQHLRRIWPSTPRAIEHARLLARMLLAALVAYAAFALMLRVVETVTVSFGPLLDLTLTLTSLAGAGGTWMALRAAR